MSDQTYYQIFNLLLALEEQLKRGRVHFRNRAGQLLTRLDEVVQAILTDDLSGTGNDSSGEGQR